MRMREENYYKVWNNVVNYYDTMDVKAKSHSKWASNDFFVRRYVPMLILVIGMIDTCNVLH